MEQFNYNQMANNQQLREVLNGIRKAVQGEREDELFYNYLIDQAPDNDQKEIISSIRDDERRHNRLFREIYTDFTNMEVPTGEEENFETPESYLDGIRMALFGELKAVERYRNIRRRLPMGPYRDMLFDIITDELKHASMYNYLFTLNSTTTPISMNTNEESQQTTNAFNSDNFISDEWFRYSEETPPAMNSGVSQETTGAGMVQETTGGMIQGTTEGMPQQTTGEMIQGTTEGMPQETTGGMMAGTTEEMPQGTTGGMMQGTTEGMPQETTGGMMAGTTEGMPQGTTGGMMQETTKGMPQGTACTTFTCKFTPDDWIKYITPLVNYALEEVKQGVNPEHFCQKFILIGILVGLGHRPIEAFEQVEDWVKREKSKLLKMSKMSRYFEY